MPTSKRKPMPHPADYISEYLANGGDEKRALMALGRWLDMVRELVQRRLMALR